MSNRAMLCCAARIATVAAAALLIAGLLAAQTNSTGAVSGTVTDPSGRVIPGAVVILNQKATNLNSPTTTDAKGSFVFTALQPGTYSLSAVAKGFSTTHQNVIVRVNQVTNANFKLRIGAAAQTVEVTGSAGTVQVNTVTATVGGTITAQQIKDLPQIGRNFLDLAQLQPGVQLIDGGNFDPTKNGFAGLSVQGAEGRTTEINVNGADITDQTVGTTVINLPDNSIHGFQVSQSSGDTSSDIGNTGQVNITTDAGTNELHGDAFANYRSARFAANPTLAPTKPPFVQNQDGLSLGGPLWKNKLFFFVSGERYYRNAFSAVDTPDFPQYNAFYATPGFEKDADARVDWTITPSLKAFYYFTHGSNRLIPPSVVGGTSLQPFTNEDVSNLNDVSVTWTHNRWTHTFHYDHLGFFNHIYSQPLTGAPNIPIDIAFSDTGESFGPNLLSPQHTFQIDDEFKYDGSFYFGNHTLRFGVEYNHIASVVYAAFFAQAPEVTPAVSNGPVDGLSADDPLNYAPESVTFGNGQGYFSNLAVHGNPYGGAFNRRKTAYITDTWKALPNLTIDYGVHYERDPGEVNTDLVHPTVLGAAFPNLAHAASIPNNFSPTLGIAWQPTSRGDWVIRAGAGMYYENNIWNNVLFERSNYFSDAIAPSFPFTNGSPVTTPQGTCVFLCSGSGENLTTQSIGQLEPALLSAQAALQSGYAALAANAASQPDTILGPVAGTTPGVSSAPGTNYSGNPLFDDTYRTPYSVQLNFGVQHQLAPGAVVSVNLIDNRAYDLLMIQDQNMVGDANYLNQAAAIAAINGAAADLGVTPSASAQTTVQNMLNAAVAGQTYTPAGGEATPITDGIIQSELLSNSSGISLGGGANTTYGAPSYAFGGINPNFGQLSTDRNLGESDYRALQAQMLLRNISGMSRLHVASLTISYALGRLDANEFSGSFAGPVIDTADPRYFYGPNGYDRTQQLSIGGVFNLPWGVRFATVNHFESGLSQTLTLANTGLGPGEIFTDDWLGSGTAAFGTAQPIPGTQLGAFDRNISSPAQLQNLINAYNSSHAGTLTPAGNALLKAGLMTQAQMSALGLVMPSINVGVNPDELMTDSFLDTDITLAKAFHVYGDRFTITPEIDCFNLFNVGNYDPPGNVISGALGTGFTPPTSGTYGTVDSVTNTTPFNQANKFGLNTGVFAAGIPRAFQGRIDFTF
ncbi:MAG: TonB-dependent receptor [Terriglobales bacterium]